MLFSEVPQDVEVPLLNTGKSLSWNPYIQGVYDNIKNATGRFFSTASKNYGLRPQSVNELQYEILG